MLRSQSASSSLLVSLTLMLLLFTSFSQAQLQAKFVADKVQGCAPLAINFTNTTTGASANAQFRWELGNGNSSTLLNPAAIYTEEKLHTVKLTVTDGDKVSSYSLDIRVYLKPTVDFSASVTKGCLPLQVTFNTNVNPGSGNSFFSIWDFGDGAIHEATGPIAQHTYDRIQDASVSLTVKNLYGCSAAFTKENLVKVVGALKADFDPNKTVICTAGDPVSFINKSNGPGTLSYKWEYGNGDASAITNPSYVYPAPGTFNVKLNVSSSEGCTASAVKQINAYNIFHDIEIPKLVCLNSTVAFNASTIPYPLSYNWVVDGIPAAVNDAMMQTQFTYTGNHVVKVTANFGNCSVVTTKNFEVKPTPVVNDFDLKVANTCTVPATVEVKDLSANTVKWDWNFRYTGQPNAAADAVTKEASYTYNSLQTYDIRMRAYNAEGCFRDVIKQVQLSAPDVRVESKNYYPYQDIVSCGPLTTTFHALTFETITKYNWRLDGEASTSTAAEPSITINTPGNHNLVLEYETARGCKATATYNYRIIVKKKPVINIVPNATKLCGTNGVQFTATGDVQDVVSYYWYSDNQAIFTVANKVGFSYQKKGVYDVRLIADLNGCRDTIDKKQIIEVVPPFPRIQNITYDCVERGKVTFNTPSVEGDTWLWEFGDGKSETFTSYQPTISHSYPGTDGYNVNLTITHGECTLSASAKVAVLMKPAATLTASTDVACFDEGLKYEVNAPPNPGALTMLPFPPNWTGYTWHYSMMKWEYEDGSGFLGNNGSQFNSIVSFPTPGKLTKLDATKSMIRLILREATTGCLDTTNYIPFKLKGATADFQLLNNDICFNTPMQAKDLSRNYPGSPITSVEWDFGDGQKLLAQQGETVSHSYRQPGSYPVSIKIIDNGGCVSDLKQSAKSIKVNGPLASISATHDKIPKNEFVTFYNSTNDFSYYRSTYSWNFGDGTTSTERAPKHAYATPGKYTATMTATDAVTGCSSAANIDIIVENTAAAFTVNKSFVGSTTCLPMLARFSAKTYNVANLSWDFGDGTTAGNIQNPNHIYTSAGKYFVKLTAHASDGTTSVYVDSIIIYKPEAKAEANKLEVCKGETVNWTVTGTHNLGYFWDYGDGRIAEIKDGTNGYAYPLAGSYKPSLVIRDSSGCLLSATVDKILIVRPDPVLTFMPDPVSVCLGASKQLNVSGARSYTWSPAAGLNNANISNPVASLNVTTKFKVDGVDDIGCAGSKEVTVTVHQPFDLTLAPVAAICSGDAVQLVAGGADRYQWIENTAGLNSVTVATPRATPATNTLYKVVGYDPYGCFTDTATIAITVNPRPVVNAGNDQEVEGGQQVQLSATADSEINRWTWTPSSYLSCTACPAPVSIPESEIKYKVTAINKYGCAASDEVVIKLLCDEARIRIPNAFSPNNDGHNDRFTIKGISMVKNLVIYNRWGNKVFERENFFAGDASSCWDGTHSGIAQPTGTYVYMIEMECPNKSGQFMKKGTVTLVR